MEFPGRGSHRSCDLCHTCGNAGSLTHCAGPGIEPMSAQLQRHHWSGWATAGTPQWKFLKLNSFPQSQSGRIDSWVQNSFFFFFFFSLMTLDGFYLSAVVTDEELAHSCPPPKLWSLHVIIFSFAFSSFHNSRKCINHSFSGFLSYGQLTGFCSKMKTLVSLPIDSSAASVFLFPPSFNLIFAFILSRLITFTFCAAVTTILSVLCAYVCCLAG